MSFINKNILYDKAIYFAEQLCYTDLVRRGHIRIKEAIRVGMLETDMREVKAKLA